MPASLQERQLYASLSEEEKDEVGRRIDSGADPSRALAHVANAKKSGAGQQAAFDSEQPSMAANAGGFAAGLLDATSPTTAQSGEAPSPLSMVSPPLAAVRSAAVLDPDRNPLTRPLAEPSAALRGVFGPSAARVLAGAGDIVGRAGSTMTLPLQAAMPGMPLGQIPDLFRKAGVTDAAAEAAPLAFWAGQTTGGVADAIAGKKVGSLAGAGSVGPQLRFRPVINSALGGVEKAAGLVAKGAEVPSLVRGGAALATGGVSEGVLALAKGTRDIARKIRGPQEHQLASPPSPRQVPSGDASAYRSSPLDEYRAAPDRLSFYVDDATSPSASAVSPTAPTALRVKSPFADELVKEAEGFDPRGEGWNNWANKTPATPKPGITPPDTSISTPKPPPPGATRVDRTPAPMTAEQQAATAKQLETGATPEQISRVTGAPIDEVAEVAAASRTSGGTGGPANAPAPKPPPSSEAPQTSVMNARDQAPFVTQSDPRFASDSTGVRNAVAAVEARARANAAPPAPATPQLSFNQLPKAEIPKLREADVFQKPPSKVDQMTTAEKREHARSLLNQGMTSAEVAKALKMTVRQVKLLTAGK